MRRSPIVWPIVQPADPRHGRAYGRQQKTPDRDPDLALWWRDGGAGLTIYGDRQTSARDRSDRLRCCLRLRYRLRYRLR